MADVTGNSIYWKAPSPQQKKFNDNYKLVHQVRGYTEQGPISFFGEWPQFGQHLLSRDIKGIIVLGSSALVSLLSFKLYAGVKAGGRLNDQNSVFLGNRANIFFSYISYGHESVVLSVSFGTVLFVSGHVVLCLAASSPT
jgi:hypothetical protein